MMGPQKYRILFYDDQLAGVRFDNNELWATNVIGWEETSADIQFVFSWKEVCELEVRIYKELDKLEDLEVQIQVLYRGGWGLPTYVDTVKELASL